MNRSALFCSRFWRRSSARVISISSLAWCPVLADAVRFHLLAVVQRGGVVAVSGEVVVIESAGYAQFSSAHLSPPLYVLPQHHGDHAGATENPESDYEANQQAHPSAPSLISAVYRFKNAHDSQSSNNLPSLSHRSFGQSAISLP